MILMFKRLHVLLYLLAFEKCMHPLWIHTFFKGYILGSKLVGAWQGSTPSKDTWDFFQYKFTSLEA